MNIFSYFTKSYDYNRNIKHPNTNMYRNNHKLLHDSVEWRSGFFTISGHSDTISGRFDCLSA